MNTKISEEQMANAGLSEEEIAALEEADAEGDEGEETSAAADDKDGGSESAKSETDDLPQASDDDKAATAADQADGDKPAEDAKSADDKPAEDAKSDDDKPAEQAADDDKSADDDAGDKDTPPEPPQVDSFRQQLLARGIPEDYEAQLAAANTAIEELDQKLADGEIDYAAHAKENRTLTRQVGNLEANKREAEFVAANNETSANQHWDWEVERFIEENDEFKNPVIYGALRGALDELYQVEDNAGKAYRWFLKEAATQVRSAFSMDKDDTKTDKDPEKSKAEEISKAIDDKPQDPPPTTLADIPAASEEEDAGNDRFSSIDKLDGMDLEAALSKMPKAEADKYLDSRNY